MSARPVRERVLEQPEVLELVADPRLERAKVIGQPADFRRGRLVEMAGDEIARAAGLVVRDRDAELGLAEGQRKDRLRQRRRDGGPHAVRFEEAANDLGFDRRVRAKYLR